MRTPADLVLRWAVLRCAAGAALLGATACSSIPPGRSAIDSVRLVNATELPSDQVTDKLATTASPKFVGLFRGIVYDYEIFDAATLQRDLARVERYYRGRGFFEAHARAGRVIHVSGSHVRVEIVVDEGPPMRNRNVDVEGLEGVPLDIASDVRLAAHSALPAGGRFDEDKYKAAQTAVLRALTERGYAYAKLTGGAQADLASHVVDYELTATPGPPSLFGTITIVGLDPDAEGPRLQELEEEPVRRALNIKPGTPFSTSAIDAATQALLDLGVFSAVQITPTLSDPPATWVPLAVRVEPTKLRGWTAGGGFELDDIKTEIHGLVGWEDHNFFGGLRTFSVEFKPGVVLYPTRIGNYTWPDQYLLEERLRAQLRQPSFLGSRWTGFVRPEMNVFPLLVQANPSPSQPVIGYIEPRGAVGIDRRFGKHFTMSIAPNVQGEFPIVYRQPPASADGSNPNPPDILLAYPQLVTTLDFRDNAVHPHSGFYLSNDFQVAVAGARGGQASRSVLGTAGDVRIQPEARGYLPVARRVTFAARGSIGLLFPINYGHYVEDDLGDDIHPPAGNAQARTNLNEYVDRDIELADFRGFFSGGPSSNRGYPLRGIASYGVVPFLTPANAQQAAQLNCIPGSPGYDASNCSVPIGGFTLWELSAEFRFAVSGPFGVATFCDAGDVSPEPANFRFNYLHLSCGAGMRYDTPVGPLRLDIGARIPPLQVLGTASPQDAAEHQPPPLLGLPLALSFGLGEAF